MIYSYRSRTAYGSSNLRLSQNHPLSLQTIASVFSVREQPGMPMQELVLNYLRNKYLLLLLDNCEHLIETCAQLADQFLHNSPNLKIIASSREALVLTAKRSIA
jgi:non-specific serine/threonine protein kinase